MKRTEVRKPACKVILGKPFGDNPKCPILNNINQYFTSAGWYKKNYTSYGCSGEHIANLIYELFSEDSVKRMEVIIKGYDKHCEIIGIMSTYGPKNRIIPIENPSEDKIIADFENFLRNPKQNSLDFSEV